MTDMHRKLATVRKIEEIRPIPDADRIVAYRVGGWWVVDKKGAYEVGDLAVYCEVDSFLSENLAPWLVRSKPKTYNGVKGERLRTIRLKGQLSQGMLLPMNVLDQWDSGELITLIGEQYYQEGEDVTEELGIQKWEPVVPAQLRGVIRGNFPSQFPKTDLERCQNLTKYLEKYSQMGWVMEEKLDGSSFTCYLSDGKFGVCSRNLDLKESEDNTFWRVANRYSLREKLEALDFDSDHIAIQAELIGPGIQKNPYGLTEADIRVFDIHDGTSYLHKDDRAYIVEKLGLPSVPTLGVLRTGELPTDVEEILAMAEGKSQLNGTEREGIAFKSLDDPNVSFKAISNKFLLKTKG